MRERRIKKKLNRFILGLAFFSFSLFLYLHKNLILFVDEVRNEIAVEDVIYNNIENNETIKKENRYDFIGVLEIPSINLSRGFLDKENIYNDVDYNIKILDESAMPNEKGNVILASHSGNSKIAFFKNLYKLKIQDKVYIYYNGLKYEYKIYNKYEEIKDGDIDILESRESMLTLTTCNQSHKGYQLVILCELVKSEIL